MTLWSPFFKSWAIQKVFFFIPEKILKIKYYCKKVLSWIENKRINKKFNETIHFYPLNSISDAFLKNFPEEYEWKGTMTWTLWNVSFSHSLFFFSQSILRISLFLTLTLSFFTPIHTPSLPLSLCLCLYLSLTHSLTLSLFTPLHTPSLPLSLSLSLCLCLYFSLSLS